jgi:hypothetical protein
MAHETANTISDRVLRKVQDESYGWDDVKDLFNSCLRELAGVYMLPALETEGTVTTSSVASYVALPDDYMKSLFRCYSETTNRRPVIFASLRLLLKRFSPPDNTGPVIGVAVRGNNLHYQRLAAETLDIFYFRQPDLIEEEEDTPTSLPEHLASDLLYHYACKEIFDQIEDGIEGDKTNTQWHEKKYVEKVIALERFVGAEGKEPQEITDEMDLDSLID